MRKQALKLCINHKRKKKIERDEKSIENNGMYNLFPNTVDLAYYEKKKSYKSPSSDSYS